MSKYGLIKIFNKLYVGFQERYRSELIDEEKPPSTENYRRIPYNLGFVTPYEDTVAGRKRQDTVNRWSTEQDFDYVWTDGKCNRVKKAKTPEQETRTIDNEQLTGFKLAEEVRRTYWGGGNVVWRIEDPRGFEIEISSANLARIIDEVGILPGGVIPGKCIYGRNGKDNIIIPEGSDLWNESVKDAEEIEKRSKTLSKSGINPGAKCTLKSGESAIYLGQYWMTSLYHPYFSRQHGNYYRHAAVAASLLTNREHDLFSYDTERYHAYKMMDASGIRLYKEKKIIATDGENEDYNTTEKCVAFLNSGECSISYAASGKSTYSSSGFVFNVEKPTTFEFFLEQMPKEQIMQYLLLNEYRCLIDFKLKPSNAMNIVLINDEGLSLGSMKILVKQISNSVRDGKYDVDHKSIKVIFTNNYIVEPDKLTKGILTCERDGLLEYATYEAIGKGLELRIHHEAAEIRKFALDEALNKFSYSAIKFKAGESAIYIKG